MLEIECRSALKVPLRRSHPGNLVAVRFDGNSARPASLNSVTNAVPTPVSLMRIVSRSCASACAMARVSQCRTRLGPSGTNSPPLTLGSTEMTEAGCAFERENVPGIRGTQMAEDKGQAGADLIWRGPGCG